MIELKFPNDAELKRMFDAVPQLEKRRASDRVLRPMAKPIVTRSRQLAPRGNPTDRAKRSQRQAQAADWNYPLHKSITYVVRKYGNAAGLAVIGPSWPKGNKAYFDTSPKGRRVFYWGKDAGKIRPQIRNWIVQAFDETRAEQVAIAKRELKKVMDEIWRSS